MDITIKEVFDLLKKSIVFILITAIVFATGSFFVSGFLIPKTYTSNIKLYVETTTSENANNYNNLNYAVALVNTYIEMLQTNTFYTQVSEDLNNAYSPDEISKMISFSPLNGTEVFEATIKAYSPIGAKQVADSVAKISPGIIGNLNKTATLRIVDEPMLPTGPSSPNVLNNTIIAFVLGAVLAVITVVLRKVFDVKISYNDDMTTICDIPVLATIPDFENLSNNQKLN